MTTNGIEALPIEQPSSQTPSRVNTNVKSNSSSNIHDLKYESMPKNTASMNCKTRRTRNTSIAYDISLGRKIRIAKYTIFLLF